MTSIRLQELENENRQLREQLAAYYNKDQSAGVEDKFKQLLQILPAGVVVIDGMGCVDQCNPTAQHLLGDDLIGQMWRKIVQRCFAPKADDGYEISLRDGRRISIQTRALVDNHGQLVLMTDMTETREVQAQQAQSQRLAEMGKMMASLAHQIRTPLSAALLYTDNLLSGDLDRHQVSKFSMKAKNRLQNIERQISDMLIFARVDTPLVEVADVELILRKVEDALDIPLSQYDADFDIDSNQLNLSIKCNLEVLVGAIISIVINALQASSDQPIVRVFALKVKNSLVLSVGDNGPGMTARELHIAQQPFQTTKAQGTGLGISVAQQVAKAHGGYFEIKSAQGKGTVASFWIPVSA